MAVPELDDALRQRLIRRFGGGVGAWLDEAPAVLSSIGSRWEIEFGPLIPRGSMSVVIRCRTSEGRDAVCKLCPDKPRLAREAAALQSWATPHAPTVFAADTALGALLMEAIEPGTSLADVPTRPRVDSVADLLTSLHDHASTSDGFPPVTDRIVYLFDAWDRELGRSAELRDLIPADLPARGRQLALRLAKQPVPAVLLHGDLNPGNVLDGGPRRGLVAIDPAPCLGDAAFDAVDLVFAAATDPEAIASYIDDLAPAMGVPPNRLHAWCTAFAGMNGSEIAQSQGRTAASECLLAFAARAPAA